MKSTIAVVFFAIFSAVQAVDYLTVDDAQYLSHKFAPIYRMKKDTIKSLYGDGEETVPKSIYKREVTEVENTNSDASKESKQEDKTLRMIRDAIEIENKDEGLPKETEETKDKAASRLVRNAEGEESKDAKPAEEKQETKSLRQSRDTEEEKTSNLNADEKQDNKKEAEKPTKRVTRDDAKTEDKKDVAEKQEDAPQTRLNRATAEKDKKKEAGTEEQKKEKKDKKEKKEKKGRKVRNALTLESDGDDAKAEEEKKTVRRSRDSPDEDTSKMELDVDHGKDHGKDHQ